MVPTTTIPAKVKQRDRRVLISSVLSSAIWERVELIYVLISAKPVSDDHPVDEVDIMNVLKLMALPFSQVVCTTGFDQD